MFKHLFDSSALIHRQLITTDSQRNFHLIQTFHFRFYIKDGQVTYQCRFIQTETFKRNMVANRIVVTEFGTSSVPDPCHSIFQRFSSRFKSSEKSDNTMISIYPFGDEYYSFTESPVIHKWVGWSRWQQQCFHIYLHIYFRINIETLQTEGRVFVSDFVGIVSHTSHPHVLPNGTVKQIKKFCFCHVWKSIYFNFRCTIWVCL